MTKTPSLGIRVQPEVKVALERAAKHDVRSMSSMAEKILVDWLRANGYLDNGAGPGVRLKAPKPSSGAGQEGV